MILHEARDFCRKLAPDLPENFYVLDTPQGMPRADGVIAFCLTAPCDKLKSVLSAAGEWSGPGPAILFCDQYKIDDSLAILLHETAHIFPHSESDYIDEKREFCDRSIAAFNANPSGQIEGKPRWFPSHDGNFIRRSLHLWWRAALLGKFTPLENMHVSGWDYDTAPIAMYWTALGNEAVVMQDKTFDEIAAIQAPDEFRKLFAEDVTIWASMEKLYGAKAASNSILNGE